MTGTIDVREIQPGDLVVLRDPSGNHIEGEVHCDDGVWSVVAFGVMIPFARYNQTLRLEPGVAVVGHIPQLTSLGGD